MITSKMQLISSDNNISAYIILKNSNNVGIILPTSQDRMLRCEEIHLYKQCIIWQSQNSNLDLSKSEV